MIKTIIIGAGAGGLAAAIKLKQLRSDIEVTVLEQFEEPCKKIYATGNGRCNLTNRSAEGFEETKDFFASLGMILRESEEGRMYPYSNQAATVVKTLVSACKKYGIEIITSCKAERAEYADGKFSIFTNQGVFSSDALILASGGKSQSSLGSDGSGYELAKCFGHKITALSPALVQLVSSTKNCRALKGLRTKCNLKIEINGEIVAEEYGELLFADYGISGIVTMNLSEFVNDEKLKSGEERCVAIIDFTPDISENELIAHCKEFGSLEGILPSRLWSILLKQSGGDSEKAAQYSKSWRLIITGTKGYSFAQITKGGVSLDELSPSWESMLCENLYIIGELADRQFKCGGFNLDNAFSSGIKAAKDISEKLYDKN